MCWAVLDERSEGRGRKTAALLVRHQEEKSMSYYLHEVPGRLRIQIPSLKRNSQSAQDVRDLLEGISGVESASVNTFTGSVTVHYDPETMSSRAILTLLTRENYIDVARAIPNHRHVEKAISRACHAASKALLGFALDRALQGSPLSILTTFI
jgi:cation transport ATPase